MHEELAVPARSPAIAACGGTAPRSATAPRTSAPTAGARPQARQRRSSRLHQRPRRRRCAEAPTRPPCARRGDCEAAAAAGAGGRAERRHRRWRPPATITGEAAVAAPSVRSDDTAVRPPVAPGNPPRPRPSPAPPGAAAGGRAIAVARRRGRVSAQAGARAAAAAGGELTERQRWCLTAGAKRSRSWQRPALGPVRSGGHPGRTTRARRNRVRDRRRRVLVSGRERF